MTSKPNIKPHWVIIHPFQLRLQRGIETYVWGLSTALARSGVDVDIITWSGPLTVPVEVKKAGVRLIVKPRFRYFEGFFASFFYINKLMKKRYDHIFTYFAGYGEGTALNVVRIFRKQPFSVVFHFPPSLVPHRYNEFRRWHFDHVAEYLIGVSKATAHEVAEWSGRKVDVIGHGINVNKFQPALVLRKNTRKELGFSEGTPVLISVAAMEERKGMQWGIKAMPEILEHFPDLQYILVGDGDFRQSLIEQVHKLELEPHVQFVGFKQNIHPYLCAADVMLVLSKGEASSISLLEALSCELPAITSNHPPFDELIKNAWGIIVDEENTSQIVDIVLALLCDKEKRSKMGFAGRENIILDHNWDKIAQQYIQLVGKTNG